MALNRKRWIVLGAIIAAVAAFNLFSDWYDDPLRRARRGTGLEIPASSKLLYAKDTTSGALDDGTVLIVFAVPSEFAPRTEADCIRLGYQYGEILRPRYPHWENRLQHFFDPSRASCHYFEGDSDAWKVIVFQDEKIMLYAEFT